MTQASRHEKVLPIFYDPTDGFRFNYGFVFSKDIKDWMGKGTQSARDPKKARFEYLKRKKRNDATRP